MASTYIQLSSKKFPILPGEEDELTNEGTWGKALAEYLLEHLNKIGYQAAFVCCEDWGWWVELKGAPFALGVCVYCNPEQAAPTNFVCTDGVTASRKWSWRQFRFLDTTAWSDRLNKDLIKIFEADEEIEILCVSDELPF